MRHSYFYSQLISTCDGSARYKHEMWKGEYNRVLELRSNGILFSQSCNKLAVICQNFETPSTTEIHEYFTNKPKTSIVSLIIINLLRCFLEKAIQANPVYTNFTLAEK